MADMQRAINSKRSIAEITLTRMCDTRLAATNEALVLRIEELEKTVRMLKMGVPMTSTPENAQEQKPKKPEEKNEQKIKNTEKTDTKAEKSFAIYGQWGPALRKLSEIKKSLSVGFSGASVYTDGSGKFVIKMSGFFADKLKDDPTDLAIIRGVIAEQEGLVPDAVSIVIESNDKSKSNNSDNIEDLFK